MNLNHDAEGFEDPFVEATFQAYKNVDTPEEALNVLAFGAGVDVETAIERVVLNAPELVVRDLLKTVFLGFIDAGRHDLVLESFEAMARLAIRREEEGF